METCKADLLLYAFEIKDVGLLIYLLDFPRLQQWFSQSYLPQLPRPEYGLSVMADENRSEGRVVPIERVVKAVPTRCFLVSFEEEVYQVRTESMVDIQGLRQHFLRGRHPP
jgi:hypothetical protein